MMLIIIPTFTHLYRYEDREPRYHPRAVRGGHDADHLVAKQRAVEVPSEAVHDVVLSHLPRDRGRAAVVRQRQVSVVTYFFTLVACYAFGWVLECEDRL